MIFRISLFFLIVLAYSCRSNKDVEIKGENKSVQLDTVEFQLTKALSEGSLSKSYTSFTFQDTIFFVEDDLMSNQLIIYVFNNKNETVDWFTKSYPKDWSKSLTKRYYFKDRDDFYILDDKSRLFHFKNDSVLQKSALNEFDPYVKLSGLFLSQNNEFKVDTMENVTTRIFYSEPDSLLHEEYFEPVTAVFNLSDNTFKLLDYNLPQKFKSKYLGMYNVYNQNYSKKDTIIYWSSIEDKLTIYDIQDKSKTDKIVRSKYQDEDFHKISVDGIPKNRDEFYLQSIEQGQYAYLIHNPYLDLYYRVFQHPISRKDHFETDRKNGGYSIMILDNNFKVVDEILLSKRIKTIFALIPTKKGLLVNTSKGYVLSDKDDKLRFLRIHL